MDLQCALEILQIEQSELNNITMVYLKKKYHKLALQNHPDKNGNTIESKEHFQKINEAYHVLKREISIIDIDTGNNIPTESSNAMGYQVILNLFIDSILKGKYNVYISSIIKDIVNGCKTISIKLFEDLDKDNSIAIYNFLIKYKNILHLNDATIEEVRGIIVEKYKDVQIYIVNPSINDLFDNNIYKLNLNNELYFVPLWHNELYFDSSDGDIIVKCIPELPSNMSIDENNNLLVVHRVSFTYSLLMTNYIVVLIGYKSFEIPTNKLLCKMSQTYIFKNQGVAQITEKCDDIDAMYNVDKKGDVIINIIFEQ